MQVLEISNYASRYLEEKVNSVLGANRHQACKYSLSRDTKFYLR